MVETLLEVKELSFSYETGKKILKNIDFTIGKGEFIAMIGANGAGKTTFLKVILGQLPCQKGKIIRNYKKLSYVSQAQDKKNEVFPATVLEIVLLNLTKEIGFFVKEKHIQKAREALKTVGMLEYENRLLRELSGGQRQRVMIAKAIVQKPELLILDEPTTGLDKKAVEDLFETLTELNRQQKMSIFMISHDLFRVRTWCQKVYLLEEGELYATV